MFINPQQQHSFLFSVAIPIPCYSIRYYRYPYYSPLKYSGMCGQSVVFAGRYLSHALYSVVDTVHLHVLSPGCSNSASSYHGNSQSSVATTGMGLILS